jgi:preprotein translocase subunit SecG
MLLGILLTLHILVCIALIGVVLLQRSEGGGLVSSGPSGFMTARGGSDLLTRTTWILGTLFIVLSLGLTLLAGASSEGRSVTEQFEVESVDPDKLNQPPPQAPAAPGPAEAPLPTLRNPLEAPPAPAGSAPLAPAPAAPAQ